MSIHLLGLVISLTIFVVIVYEKFGEEVWITLVITGAVVVLRLVIRNHYRMVSSKLRALYIDLNDTLHETAFSLQKCLPLAGHTVVIIAARVK